MAIEIDFKAAVSGSVVIEESELDNAKVATGIIVSKLQELGFDVGDYMEIEQVRKHKTERERIAEEKENLKHHQV